MTDRIADITPRTYARTAGLGYLMIIVCGIFAEFFARGSLIVPGDAVATAGNIAASEQLFRIGIAGDLIMLLSDVVLAWALYAIFKPVHASLAMLAAFLRLVHAAVYGANLLNLFMVLRLLSGANELGGFDAGHLQSLVSLFLNGHSTGYLIGLVFFGLHCAVLGYLIYRSGYIPRILGILLLFAAFGYLVDCFAQVLMPNYQAVQSIFMLIVFVPALIGELSLSLWLLLAGGKKPEFMAGLDSTELTD